jgi:phage terminase small subunit
MAASTLPAPPEGLSERSAAFWSTITEDYELAPHHFQLLRSACQIMDRLDAVAASIAEAGLMVTGSKGQPRPNPLLSEERNLRIALARILRELDLEGEPAPDPRMPRR